MPSPCLEGEGGWLWPLHLTAPEGAGLARRWVARRSEQAVHRIYTWL